MSQEKNTSPTKLCPVCGTRLNESATRCLVCGTELDQKAETKKTPEVRAKRLPEITLSLPAALGILALFLTLATVVIFLVINSGNGTEVAEIMPEVGTPTASPTETTTATITLTPTPYTTEIFAQNIKDFNTNYAPFNFDIDQLREIIEIQLLREKLVDEVTQDLPRTKDEVWARHILVETNEVALEVLSLLEEGEDFDSLAARFSTDESNREQGGNLGWFDENMMVPEFSGAAFSLAEGEISEPIETTFGFHIIQVIGKRVSQVLPSEFTQRQQAAFAEWLAEQRNTRDDIEINPNWDQFVPNTPEVPQQYLAELFQLSQ